MRRYLLGVRLLALVLVPAVGTAQDRRIPRSCLPDSAVLGTLAGELQERTYPGPPHYESVAHGDAPETGFYLRPAGWACQPAPGDTVGVYTRDDIEWIQLLLTAPDYPRLRRYVGKRIRIRGVLRPAETGHHHTPLVLEPTWPLRVEVRRP